MAPQLPPLLSELQLGTYLQYSPQGTSEVAKRSRDWMRAVKAGRPNSIDYALDQLKASLEATGLDRVLGSDVSLIPVPRSAPLSSPNALWPAGVICSALVRRGMGAEVLPCLTRVEPVRRSATAGKGERPTADEHLRTIALASEIVTTKRITLVDDVVTLGRTILAAGSHVVAAHPSCSVRAFGLIHTLGQGKEIAAIEAPYFGRLVRSGGYIRHDPDR